MDRDEAKKLDQELATYRRGIDITPTTWPRKFHAIFHVKPADHGALCWISVMAPSMNGIIYQVTDEVYSPMTAIEQANQLVCAIIDKGELEFTKPGDKVLEKITRAFIVTQRFSEIFSTLACSDALD